MPVFKIASEYGDDQVIHGYDNHLTQNILLNDYINKAPYTGFYIIKPRNKNNFLDKYKNKNNINIYIFNDPAVKHPTNFSLFKMPMDAYIDFTVQIIAPNIEMFDELSNYPSQLIEISKISFDFKNFMYSINNTNINIPFQKTTSFIDGTTYGTAYNYPMDEMDDIIYLSTLTSTVEPDPTLNRFHGYLSRIDMYIYIGDRSFIHFKDPVLMGNSSTSLYTILFDLSIQIFSGKIEDNDLLFNVNCTIPINSNNV